MRRPSIPAFRPEGKHQLVAADEIAEFLKQRSCRALLDLNPLGIIALDASGGVLYINQAAWSTLLMSSPRLPTGEETVERLSIVASHDLSSLASGQSVGHRRLCLSARDRDRADIEATLYSFPEASGAPGLRLAFFHTPSNTAHDGDPASLPARPEAHALLQRRLEPMMTIGLRAFKAKRRILLLGETGVGKTTLALQMHRQSGPPARPFVHINCSSITESLFEAEMFGYERGAFTGALAAGKPGFIEAAAGGTLFLDEIGDMPLSQQAKLLTFLENGTIQRVGSPKSKVVDAYVVCATNRDLTEDVKAKRFRQDLYYRIAMIPLDVPPLRAYREELPLLIDTMIVNLNLKRKVPLRLSPDCRRRLIEHDYPGNMRELIGLVARLDVVADDVAQVGHLPDAIRPNSKRTESLQEQGSLRAQVQAFERSLIEQAVAQTRSKRQAARLLGIDVASLIRKLAKP